MVRPPSSIDLATINHPHGVLFGVFLKPEGAHFVGQMGHLEVGECDAETVAVGACSHHANFHGAVGLHPCVAHHGVGLVVERIEDLDGVEASHSLDPQCFYRLVKGDDAPVGGVMGNYVREVAWSNRF